jgi:hypothetical protein
MIAIDYGRAFMLPGDRKQGDDGDRGFGLSPTEAAFREQVLSLIARIEEKLDQILDDQG